MSEAGSGLLQFEWDEAKNEVNQIKHDIVFEEAALIFSGITLTEPDERRDYGESREINIGQLAEQVVIVVVHTDRNGVTRLISARTANRTERRRYDDYCKKITQ
jgi:uncharacterized DUF497 family protein